MPNTIDIDNLLKQYERACAAVVEQGDSNLSATTKERAFYRNAIRARLLATERLQWTVTQLRSALENWGRHHDWCRGPSPLQCNCGYRAALETGYEVGAGASRETTRGEPTDASLRNAAWAVVDFALNRGSWSGDASSTTLTLDLTERDAWEAMIDRLHDVLRSEATPPNHSPATASTGARGGSEDAPTPEPCRIYEYDGAWKCYAHNRVWGAITGAGEPCPGWNESAGPSPRSNQENDG